MYVKDLSGITNSATKNITTVGMYIFNGIEWNSIEPTFYGFKAKKLTGSTSYQTNINNIIYDTEIYDTANSYDPVSSRFTPKIAGYYQVNAGIRVFVDANNRVERSLIIYKNDVSEISGINTISDGPVNIGVNGVVYLNGTTDYISVKMYSSNNFTADNLPISNFFEAYLIGK